MELAGLSCAQALARSFPVHTHQRVLVCCGPGNQVRYDSLAIDARCSLIPDLDQMRGRDADRIGRRRARRRSPLVSPQIQANHLHSQAREEGHI